MVVTDATPRVMEISRAGPYLGGAWTNCFLTYAGNADTLPNVVSRVTVELTIIVDRKDTAEVSNGIGVSGGWSLREAIVEAERTEIPLKRTGEEPLRLRKEMRLGAAGSKSEPGAMERVLEERAGGSQVCMVDESPPGERTKVHPKR